MQLPVGNTRGEVTWRVQCSRPHATDVSIFYSVGACWATAVWLRCTRRI